MERLTKRELSILGDACYCKCHSNDCDYECDECNILSEGANKLKTYEDAEEQLLKATGADLQSMIGEFMHYYNLQKEGRLVELPCKAGDTIYKVWYKPCHHGEEYPDSYGCCGCEDDCDLEKAVFEFVVPSLEWVLGHLKTFGESVWFLTREEAETTLERMG